MKISPATRTQLLANMTTDFDPTGSTIEVAVDGSWYPATWVGAPVQAGPKWTQVARTTGYFAGPDVTANGAVVLDRRRHLTSTRVTAGGSVIVNGSTPVDVA